MSAIGDVFAGLKKVMLMQDELARLQRNVDAMATELRRTRDYAAMIDRRLIRLETMVEMTTGRRPAEPPRIEG